MTVDARGRTPLWVWGLSLVPGLANLVPVLSSAAATPPGRVFLGFRHQATDVAQYLAIARECADTLSPAAHNPFVSDAHDGRFVIGYLWALGLLRRLTGLDLVWLYHGLGLVAATAFFWASYRLASRLMPTARQAALAFVFVTLSTGTAWVLPALTGAERTEAVAYFWNWSSFGSAALPMWCAAHACLALALLAQLDARPVLAGLLAFLAYVTHPYTGAVAIALLGALAFVVVGHVRSIPWQKRLLAPGVGGLLIGALALWQLGDPVFAATARNASLWSPHYALTDAALAYGPLLALAALGLVRPGWASRWFVLGWLVLLVVATQLPNVAGVKFQYLVHLPLAIAAARGLASLSTWAPLRAVARRSFVLPAVAAVLTLGPATVLGSELRATTADPFLFRDPDELALLDALEGAPPGAVLTDLAGGNLVPWRSGHPVFLGHWFLSFDFPKRQAILEALLSQSVPLGAKREILASARLRYAIETASTRRLGRLDEALVARVLSQNAFGRVVLLSDRNLP